MENVIERFENEKYRLSIYQDDFNESPREFNDCFGKMICWSRNYCLGDNHNYDDREDFFVSLAQNLGIDTTYEVYDEEYDDNYEEDREIQDIVNDVEEKVVILPLYLYDHSGISMRTYRHGYHANWDCGQVGYIYVTYDDIVKEYGEVNEESIERATKLLEAEVKEYSQYLEGDVYYYTLEEKKVCECCNHIEYETVDCVGGFYGYDLKNMLSDVYLPKEELNQLVGEEYKIA